MDPSRARRGAIVLLALLCAVPSRSGVSALNTPSSGQIDDLERSLREAFTDAEPIAFDSDSDALRAHWTLVRKAEKDFEDVENSLKDADPDDPAAKDPSRAAERRALEDRWELVSGAEYGFKRLHEELASGPLDEAGRAELGAQVRAVADSLNKPLARGPSSAIDAESLVSLYTDPSRWKRTTAALAPILENYRLLQRDLAKSPGGSPEISAELGSLMDGMRGLSGPRDLTRVMQRKDYPEMADAIARALKASQSVKVVSPDELRRLNETKSSLDDHMAAIMRDQVVVPSPGEVNARGDSFDSPRLDETTIAFQASLRELFPKTAAAIWNRIFPGSTAMSDPEKTSAYSRAIHEARPEFLAQFAKLPDSGFALASLLADPSYYTRFGVVPESDRAKVDGKKPVDSGATPKRLQELWDKYNGVSFLPSPTDSAALLTLGVLRMTGMIKNAKPGQTVTPKHFPGGPMDLTGDKNLERTESEMVTIYGGTKDLMPYLAPFLAILHLPSPPPALMIGHAIYPDWEAELRRRWPEYAPMCGSCTPPASLSPLILRGFLRDGLQYRGLIVADWLDMGAIRKFIEKARDALPEDCRRLSLETTVLILGTRAGLDWMPGFKIENLGNATQELLPYYDSHPDFAKQFDELVAESARLRGVPLTAGKTPEARMLLKINILTQGTPKFEQTKDWSDIWSRGGLMILSFRVSILNHLLLEHRLRDPRHPDAEVHLIPNLGDMRKLAPGSAAEDLWIKTLGNNAAFNEYYPQVNWEGPEMRQAFLEEFQSMAPATSARGTARGGGIP